MKLNILIVGVFGLIFSGCKGQGGENIFERGKQLSELTDKRLKEASGLIASQENKGMLWTHNDSGNDAEIFLINEQLDVKMTVTLEGVENRDWEDITIGPGPDADKTYVYVGDIGDNKSVYPAKYIYRFPEPVFKGEQNVTVTTFDKITFKLKDGTKDTESLFIDAKTKNLYVLSKREEPVVLYELRYPQSVNDTVTAIPVMTLPFAEIVSADQFSKSGDVLIKNYDHVYFWPNTYHEDVISLLKKKPIVVDYEREPQGESIAWAADGSGFYTLSEKKKKQASFLYFYRIRKQK